MGDIDQEQQAFAAIRAAASDTNLRMWFKRVGFAPLFGDHPEVVSVTATPFSSRDRQWVQVTVWTGHRDGTGADGGRPGSWVLVRQGLKFKTYDLDGTPRSYDEWILPLRPDTPSLDWPDLGYNKELLGKGVQQMLKMVTAAIPLHQTRTDKDVSFALLNAVLTGEEPEAGPGRHRQD